MYSASGISIFDFSPGESFFSWCAGTLLFGSGLDHRGLSLALFGNVHAPRRHDLPTSLGHWHVATAGHLGTPKEVALKRTVLSFHAATATQATVDRAISAMIAAKSNISAHAILGGPAKLLPYSFPLKYCRYCVRNSRETIGRATWQLNAQWPTTWWCRTHECPLYLHDDRSATWRLPNDETGVSNAFDIDPGFHNLVQDITAILVNHGPTQPAVLRAGAFNRLTGLGVFPVNRRLDDKTILNWLRSIDAHALAGPCLGMVSELDFYDALERILRGRARGSTLAWALVWSLIGVLDREVDTYLIHLTMTSSTSNQLRLPFSEEHWDDDLFSAQIEYLVDAGTPMHSISKRLGVSSWTLRRMLKRNPGVEKRMRMAARDLRIATVESKLRTWMLQNTSSRTELLRKFHSDFEWMRINAANQMRSILDSLPSNRVQQASLFTVDSGHPKSTNSNMRSTDEENNRMPSGKV